MNLNVNGLILLALILLLFTGYIAAITVLNKFTSLEELYVRNNKRLSLILSLVNHQLTVSADTMREIRSLRQNLIIENLETKLQTREMHHIQTQEIEGLRHSNPIRRKEACTSLGLFNSKEARHALEEALVSEKDYSVKVYISNALTDIRNPESLPFMIQGLIGMHKWYLEKGISNILEFGDAIHPHFEELKNTREVDLLQLLVNYACANFRLSTKQFLFDFVNGFEEWKTQSREYYEPLIAQKLTSYRLSYLEADYDDMLKRCCRTLSDYYYMEFGTETYYTSTNAIIQKNGFWALSKTNRTENFRILMDFLSKGIHERTLISVLTKMAETNPRMLYLLEDHLEKEQRPEVRSRVAQIVANKIEYFILKLSSSRDSRAEAVLVEILKNSKINELIGFLNINKNIDIENRVVKILKEHIEPGSTLEKEFCIYLDSRILRKWGLQRAEKTEGGKTHARDRKLVQSVVILTMLSLLFAPVLFIALRGGWIVSVPYATVMRQFVIDFNYGLAYYSVAINIIYMLLLYFSYKNVKDQARLWNLKNISMLFRSKMLPSISIIAPAYNEEKTIIDSAKSLLNLNYPDYELIVVNDGSKDDTLLRLIQAFNLVRVDYGYKTSLQTAPIRGIYRNPSLPKLVVIDKSNGGKADSLNAGINVANKTYFCGIDADSLLEPDALLRLASLTLDESVETPALGGNIFPINGCTADRGAILEVNIPKNPLARFQTIEYLRAFMAGRLGWQKLNTLMIISGAFGLFRKDRIIGIGGYMTQKGIYHKDTVGEDMELVVRITRMMHEMKIPYKIQYGFNANCWTEVPEDMKSLKGQRYRWHRGLIDILFYHKRMLFNKRYGRVGLVAMPYFFIFEAFGPMLEMQGYIMVVLSAFLGMLDSTILLLLFIATILSGLIISMSSLLIAERETHTFSVKDVLVLIGYAFIENFGPRQLFSFWRVMGQVNMIWGQGGWGQIKRKGVSS